MAGTMPHAIFVETGLDGGATVAAYAAELPGCAVFAPSDAEATAGIPLRVARFVAWLRAAGEPVPGFVGDNWYEVERAAAGERRAAFSLDELPPSAGEFASFLAWLELAREELAGALDAAGGELGQASAAVDSIARQDLAWTVALGAPQMPAGGEPIDRLYAARDALTAALERGGPSADGVRRILRIAIADDLRLAERLRGG